MITVNEYAVIRKSESFNNHSYVWYICLGTTMTIACLHHRGRCWSCVLLVIFLLFFPHGGLCMFLDFASDDECFTLLVASTVAVNHKYYIIILDLVVVKV